MKKMLFPLLVLSQMALGGSKPISLCQMPHFPAEAAEVLRLHGVQTDRELLLAGQVNPAGVAEALGVPEKGVASTVRSLWNANGRDWAMKWAESCSLLLTKGSLTKNYQTTPLLALTGFPPAAIRALVRHHIGSAEALYASYRENPRVIESILDQDEVEVLIHIQRVRQGAPHAVALVDRYLSQKGGREKLKAFLTEENEERIKRSHL